MRRILSMSLVLGFVLTALGLARAAAQADAKAVIAKAIQAAGGADKLSKFKASTWSGKGKFYGLGEGIDFSIESASQPPHQSKVTSIIDINGMKFTQIRLVNGNKGWVKMMDTTEEMDKDALADAREELYASWVAIQLVPLTDPAFQLSVIGEAKVGDRPAIGIRVVHKNHRDINLYFDKEKSLLLKTETRVKDMQSGQEVSQEGFFSDYKEVDGVQRARKLTIKREGKNYVEIDFEEIKLLDKLDDSVFSKP